VSVIFISFDLTRGFRQWRTPLMESTGPNHLKIDYSALNTRCSTARISLKNMARPERFELPTLWFEDRGEAIPKIEEFFGF
jgi:hypothetical protein